MWFYLSDTPMTQNFQVIKDKNGMNGSSSIDAVICTD